MTDQELKDLVASLAEAQVKTDAQLAKTDAQLAKTDAQLAKTDAQLAKTDAKLDRLADMYGGVGDNLGYVAEEFFYNSLKDKPMLEGIEYDFLDKNVTRCREGLEREFDILLVNGCDVAIVEVKHRAHPSAVNKLTQNLGPDFIKLFPQYKDYRIHLVLAAFSVPDEVKAMALEAGVTVLQRRGDLVETLAA